MTRSDQLPAACLAARPLIDAYLLDTLDEMRSAVLASHLRSCPSCSAELGGVGRLLSVLHSLPEAPAAADLDERITLAAIAAHRRRHEHRSWLGELPRTVLRGAARTTGTFVLTVVTVALLGGAFVFAAAGFIAESSNTPFVPTEPPTAAPAVESTPVPTEAPTPTPRVIYVTPEPTVAPTPAATETPTPTPSASPTASPTPTPEPTTAPTARPEPTPTPIPTEKPKRTPSPTATASPATEAPTN